MHKTLKHFCDSWKAARNMFNKLPCWERVHIPFKKGTRLLKIFLFPSWDWICEILPTRDPFRGGPSNCVGLHPSIVKSTKHAAAFGVGAIPFAGEPGAFRKPLFVPWFLRQFCCWVLGVGKVAFKKIGHKRRSRNLQFFEIGTLEKSLDNLESSSQWSGKIMCHLDSKLFRIAKQARGDLQRFFQSFSMVWKMFGKIELT